MKHYFLILMITLSLSSMTQAAKQNSSPWVHKLKKSWQQQTEHRSNPKLPQGHFFIATAN